MGKIKIAPEGGDKMTKIIAIKVDDETWRKWKQLNKIDNMAVKKTREFLNQLFEEYVWWFEGRDALFKGKNPVNEQRWPKHLHLWVQVERNGQG